MILCLFNLFKTMCWRKIYGHHHLFQYNSSYLVFGFIETLWIPWLYWLIDLINYLRTSCKRPIRFWISSYLHIIYISLLLLKIFQFLWVLDNVQKPDVLFALKNVWIMIVLYSNIQFIPCRIIFLFQKKEEGSKLLC